MVTRPTPANQRRVPAARGIVEIGADFSVAAGDLAGNSAGLQKLRDVEAFVYGVNVMLSATKGDGRVAVCRHPVCIQTTVADRRLRRQSTGFGSGPGRSNGVCRFWNPERFVTRVFREMDGGRATIGVSQLFGSAIESFAVLANNLRSKRSTVTAGFGSDFDFGHDDVGC